MEEKNYVAGCGTHVPQILDNLPSRQPILDIPIRETKHPSFRRVRSTRNIIAGICNRAGEKDRPVSSAHTEESWAEV